MQSGTAVAVALSSVSFAAYGLSCFLSRPVKADFARLGLSRLRPLIGALQVAASLGLLAGALDARGRPLLLLSASGLAAMMLLALLVRLRIRDAWTTALPALGFLCLNLFIVASA